MPSPTSSQSWQDYRHLIQQLYVDEERSLPNVIEEVERLTGFCATERQYKRRISAWSLDKNIKNDEMKAIIAMEATRLRKGKQSLFYVRGRQVDPKKITRFARRKNINRNRDDEAHPNHPMLSQTIRCITPPPDVVEHARAPPLQSKRTHDSQPRKNLTAPPHSNNSEAVQKDTLTPPNKRPKTVEVAHQPSLSELNQARILRHAAPLSAFTQGLQASSGTNGSQPSSGTVINAAGYHEAMPKPPDINVSLSPPHKPLHNKYHSTSNATGQLSAGGYNRASMLPSSPLGPAMSNGPAVNSGGDSGLLGPVSYPTSSLRTALTHGEGDGPISATDRSPTPKLDRTISDIYQDELYLPVEHVQQQLRPDHPHSPKRNPALDKLLRAVHGRYDLYQAVSDQDSTARSSSPSRATYGTPERSPFVPGSPFFPENESHSFESGMVSPKAASLHDIPTENDSPLPLFNYVTRHQSHRHKSEERRSQTEQAETSALLPSRDTTIATATSMCSHDDCIARLVSLANL
ncbi:MAG: hypothetical protein LQ348_007345 [Seirophora lacunosa]|nr:MAG: hypothetical protein LQ348_007345 [Seirophora lacunosa]